MSKLGTQYTMESWMLANGKVGDSFFSTKKDKDITALAVHHKRKVVTERFVAVKNKPEYAPLAINLVRVSILV